MLAKSLVEVFDEVRNIPIFEGIDARWLPLLLESATVSVHYNGDKLFGQGECANFFGYVLSGAYKLRHINSEGDEQIMYIGLSGEALGIMAVMESEAIYPFDAISVGCSRFLKIPRDTFLKSWVKTPEVMMLFQSEIQQRIYKSYNERLIGHRNLEGRIAQFFLYLLAHNPCQSGSEFVELSRKEISNYLAVSSEAVIRKLSEWTKKKWIKTEASKIYILALPELERLAGDCFLKLRPNQPNKGHGIKGLQGSSYPKNNNLQIQEQKLIS